LEASRIERGAFVHPPGIEREHPHKRLVGEDRPTLRVELGDTRRERIEHVALGCTKRGEHPRLLFQILDIHRIPGDAAGVIGTAKRQIGDAQAAPLVAPGGDDRGGDHAFDGFLAAAGLEREIGGAFGLDGFDQLGLRLNHRFGAAAADRSNISIVDQQQAAVASAKPHRDRRGLDQPGKPGKPRLGLRRIGTQAAQFGFAVGKVEHPHQCRTAGRDLRIGQMPAQR
jgi:hypothetical protein